MLEFSVMRNLPLKLSVIVLAAFAAAGCAASGVTLPESQFLRVLEGKAGRIAYLGMDGNLFTIDQGGSDKYQLTDDAEGLPLDFVYAARRFAWAPDGSRIAYIGFSEQEWTLQVAEPDGSDPARLYGSSTENPVLLQWTPDGENVSFMTQTDPFLVEGATQLGLRSVPADGSGTETLLLEGYPLFFSWDPEGDRALVHTGGWAEEDTDRISILTIGSDFERNLELPPAGFLTPAWSPDGTRLLIAIEDVQGRNALVVTNLQGQTRETLATFDMSVAFTWSPDSRYVGYIASDRTRQGASGNLTIVDAATGETMFVTEEHLVHAFVWSPDGRQLIYFTQELVGDEGEQNLMFGLGVHFLDLEEWEARHPQLGEFPFIFQPTPRFRQYLLTFDQHQQGATIWSPDGEYVVLSALTGNQGVILVVTVSGNREPRQIDTGLMALWSGE